MVGVGRDLCGSSGPTSLLKKCHLERAAQDLVQVGLEYLQSRRNDTMQCIKSQGEIWVTVLQLDK